MKTAERPIMNNGTEPRKRGLLSAYSDAQKAAGVVFCAAWQTAGQIQEGLTMSAVHAVKDVVIELEARPRIVRELYDIGKINRIVTSANSLQAGEHVQYKRHVGDNVYTVEYYPKGLSKEAADAFAESNYTELTGEDYYHRFHAVRANKDFHQREIKKNYCRSDVTAMIMRDNGRIVGTAAISPTGSSDGSYEFSFGVASTEQRKGIGSTLLRDMLAVCEANGIQNVITVIDGGNHRSRRRVLGVNQVTDVPWYCQMQREDDVYLGKFTPVSQNRRVAA